jgi:signal transduction histidine kinase
MSFRHRILLALVLLGAVPSAVAVAGWALTLLRFNPARSSQVALAPVRNSARELLRVLDTTRLAPAEHRALHDHVDSLNKSLNLSRRGFFYSRYRAAGLALLMTVLGALLLYTAVLLTRSLSRQLSHPINSSIGWMARIRRHEPLPPEEHRGGAPEFAALRSELRETAASLRQARQAELEAERLRAFREVARRVAHEMKNPLTPVRFAIGHLERAAIPEQSEALDVLRVETGRLEQLARDFANLGRLPEGPAAEVDLGELLDELLRTSLPESMRHRLTVAPDAPRIIGHYDPLRRAFGNLLRNAVEACAGEGRVEVTVSAEAEAGGVRIDVIDHGPGVPPEKQSVIFEPYVTGKAEGTGLGLAIVKQAVDFHRGTIEVTQTPGGGATFTIRLPERPVGLRPAAGTAGYVEQRVAERRRRSP